MQLNLISLYDTQFHSKEGKEMELEWVLNDIKKGRYEDKVMAIRLAKSKYKTSNSDIDKNILKELKGTIPRFTVSGLFKKEGRSEINLANHSGFIDIDIDNLTPEEIVEYKAIFANDKYCYSCFVTCGGDGLSFIAKILPTKHLDSFEGFSDYFFRTYGVLLPIDNAHKNVANTRNLSFDPELFCNPNSETFKEYLKKKKEQKILKFVYAKNDFERIISDIENKGIDFCDTYELYRDIGFAIGSKFGLSGFDYFNRVCQYGTKYDLKKIQKDYKYFCKGGHVSIATFYWRCSQFGIETYSKETKIIGSFASMSKKTGKKREDVIKTLVNQEGLKEDNVKEIVNQIYDENIEVHQEEGIIPEIKMWLKHNHNLRRNEITNYLEDDGIEIKDRELNTLYIEGKELFGNKIQSTLIKEVLFSNSISSYNPLMTYFQDNLDKIPLFPEDIVSRLISTLEVKDKGFAQKFITKWLVSIIASAHGEISPLMLILQGEQNVGKSRFFIDLLPESLRKYFCTIRWDKGKDDQITLTLKLLVLDDELENHDRTTNSQMKATLSTPSYFIRLPYGTSSQDIKRLAVLCGTSNPMTILKDPTGNRRFIPIQVLSRDFNTYNDICKDELFMALYQMYKGGYKWELTTEEIQELKNGTLDFVVHTQEFELVKKYFSNGFLEMTTSDIKVFIENKTNQRLNIKTLGAELERSGFAKKSLSDGRKCYLVNEITFGEKISEEKVF